MAGPSVCVLPISTYADFCVVFAVITFVLIIVVPMMPDTRHGHVPDGVGVPLDVEFAKDVETFPAWLRFTIYLRCSGWLVSLLVSALVGGITGFALFSFTRAFVRN